MDYLSEEVVMGLQALSEDSKLINDDSFKSLVDVSIDILLELKPPSVLLSSLSSVDPIIAKQGHATISSFILEAAKLNADPSVLSGILEEQKMTQPRQTHLLNKYKEVKPQLRKQLSQTLFHPPKVVDVDWRLDYFLKANSVEKINIPIYRIVLQTTQEDGTTTPVTFACTVEQLQDLVSKLKDASKQIDRSAGKA